MNGPPPAHRNCLWSSKKRNFFAEVWGFGFFLLSELKPILALRSFALSKKKTVEGGLKLSSPLGLDFGDFWVPLAPRWKFWGSLPRGGGPTERGYRLDFLGFLGPTSVDRDFFPWGDFLLRRGGPPTQ